MLLGPDLRDPLVSALELLALPDLLPVREVCAELRELVAALGIASRAAAADPRRLLELLARLCGADGHEVRPCPSPGWGRELVAGLTLEVARADGLRALCAACASGRLGLARWIWSLGFGSDPEACEHRCAIVGPDGGLIGEADLLRSACAGGDLAAVQWARSLGGVDAGRIAWAVGTACVFGKTEVALWLLSDPLLAGSRQEVANVAINRACRGGHLETAKALADTVDEDTRAEEMLALACERGHLEVAGWLLPRCLGQDPDVSRGHVSDFFRAACGGGRLDVARWLWSYTWGEPACGLTLADIRVDARDAGNAGLAGVLEATCAGSRPSNPGGSRDHLAVARWLWSLGFDLTDVRANAGYALRGACYGGSVALMRWLWSRRRGGARLGLADLRAFEAAADGSLPGPPALVVACSWGRLALARWLWSRGLGVADLCDGACGVCAVRFALMGDRAAVLLWLLETGAGPLADRCGHVGAARAFLAGADADETKGDEDGEGDEGGDDAGGESEDESEGESEAGEERYEGDAAGASEDDEGKRGGGGGGDDGANGGNCEGAS